MKQSELGANWNSSTDMEFRDIIQYLTSRNDGKTMRTMLPFLKESKNNFQSCRGALRSPSGRGTFPSGDLQNRSVEATLILMRDLSKVLGSKINGMNAADFSLLRW